jgi:hypothetical protein
MVYAEILSRPGEMKLIHASERVRYSTPGGSQEETIRGFAKAMS